MRYDRDGFPIPPDFNPAAPDGSGPTPARRHVGGGKRIVVVALIAGLLLPAVFGPTILPMVREFVVVWSLEQATLREVEDDLPGAVAHMTRAIDWFGDDPELLCMRALLRLENSDAAGAIADADRALAAAPTSPQPLRVRALGHVVAGDADAALADAERVVQVSGKDDPEALNHRAYMRALAGRDLSAALADIDRALAGQDEPPPEFLDTRGFVRHLLGRHQEAIDDLNVAIDRTQRQRRQVMLLAEQQDRVELARRLRWFDHALAVMHHHRGLACQAVGLQDQADQDFAVAKQKGFDPSRGVL
jgi:tetratricopeptide (TPR) repeat protein